MMNLISFFSGYIPGYEGITDLIFSGGPAMPFILLVSLGLWGLIGERLWSLYYSNQKLVDKFKQRWINVECYGKLQRKKIRLQLISEARVSFSSKLDFINTLVLVAPLLGLLGTILGMVEIFDVVAVSGSGNIRAMAAGVGQCTISTMAGLVVAISGFYFVNLLQKRVEFLVDNFSRQLAID